MDARAATYVQSVDGLWLTRSSAYMEGGGLLAAAVAATAEPRQPNHRIRRHRPVPRPFLSSVPFLSRSFSLSFIAGSCESAMPGRRVCGRQMQAAVDENNAALKTPASAVSLPTRKLSAPYQLTGYKDLSDVIGKISPASQRSSSRRLVI